MIEELWSDEVLNLRREGKLLVAGWFDAPRIEHMLKVEEVAKAHGHELALCNAVVRGKPRFTEDVREAGIRMVRRNAFRAGSAHLILVEGLAGAATRAFLGMILLVGKANQQARVFGETDAAGRFLARLLEEPDHAHVTTFIRETARS